MFCFGSRALRRRALAVTTLVLVAFNMSPVLSHEAPTGWQYPVSCCSGNDCREVPDKAISERSDGYVIEGTGEVVAYQDRRIKKSPDGAFHWCSVAGASNGKTICLFVPPRSY